MLRRSDFIAATYALSFVFANFGIAIAARIPMITTTIRSSMSVKPFLLLIKKSPEAVGDGESLPSSTKRRGGSLHRNGYYGRVGTKNLAYRKCGRCTHIRC